MSDTIIYYHGGCPDGFGAAWWLERNLYPGADLRPWQWNTPPVGDEDGKRVVCADYCFHGGELADLAERAAELKVLDHHQTSLEWIRESGLAYAEDVDSIRAGAQIVLDQSRSGVGLAGHLVSVLKGVLMPPFLLRVEDRDLWRFRYDDTSAAFAAVTSCEQTLEAWDKISRIVFRELVAEGQGIERYRKKLIVDCFETAHLVRIHDLYVPAAACPYAIGSDVAGELATHSVWGFAAYYIPKGKMVQFGLRARKGGPDVAEIAKLYGGGGHPAAAGFTVTWGQAMEMFRP